VAGLLLDACAAIWLMDGRPLSSASRRAIREAVNGPDGCFVSAFTAWEVGMLVTRRRIVLALDPQSWFEHLMALPGFRIAEVDVETLIAATRLPDDLRDPADRIIVATARARGHTIVTRDRPLLGFAETGAVAAIR
jgi:PIN domain nuclease of toxin-antitoxin system